MNRSPASPSGTSGPVHGPMPLPESLRIFWPSDRFEEDDIWKQGMIDVGTLFQEGGP